MLLQVTIFSLWKKYNFKKSVKNKTNVTNLYLSDGVHPRFSLESCTYADWLFCLSQHNECFSRGGVIWSFVLSYPPRTGVFSGRNLAYVFQQYTEAYPLAGSLTLVVFVLEISYGRLCGSINSGNRQATGPLRFWLYTFRDHTTVM